MKGIPGSLRLLRRLLPPFQSPRCAPSTCLQASSNGIKHLIVSLSHAGRNKSRPQPCSENAMQYSDCKRNQDMWLLASSLISA